MFDVRQTQDFREWLDDLRDKRAVEAIALRILRLQSGLFGDVKFFSGIGELRIHYGPGYRVYFAQRQKLVVVLLCGGGKDSQLRDIRKARQLVAGLEEF
jgi:putative addiction module killer protein